MLTRYMLANGYKRAASRGGTESWTRSSSCTNAAGYTGQHQARNQFWTGTYPACGDAANRASRRVRRDECCVVTAGNIRKQDRGAFDESGDTRRVRYRLHDPIGFLPERRVRHASEMRSLLLRHRQNPCLRRSPTSEMDLLTRASVRTDLHDGVAYTGAFRLPDA